MIRHPDKIAIQPGRADSLYFTADPHFGHSNIIAYCDRPFRDAAHMREILINNWNETVPENGIVVILGDMFWKRSQISEHAKIMVRLNGEKHLVLGNHDNLQMDDYGAIGFKSVSRITEVFVKDHEREILPIVCSHFPMLSWNRASHGSWHLHGHTHGRLKHPCERAIDVGIDAFGYRPVPFSALLKRFADG